MTSVQATAGQAQEILDDETLAEEKLLEELENGEIPSHIREARLAHFRDQARQLEHLKEKDHGVYSDITEEKDFLEMTTAEELCIVHFYHQDFRRCAIMDKHLQGLSSKYYETKFARINVEKAKFFVEKLKIRILPTIVCFKKGIVCDKIIGFEEIGNTDSFTTETLERRLAKSGVINAKDLEPEQRKSSILCKAINNKDDSDEDEW